VAPQLLRLLGIGIGPLASGIEPALAEETFTAGNRKGDDNPITHLQRFVGCADFDDFAHGLMAEYVTFLHRGDHAVEDVQIGAADRACGDLDDGVATVLDLRVGYGFAANVVLAVPGERSHRNLQTEEKL